MRGDNLVEQQENRVFEDNKKLVYHALNKEIVKKDNNLFKRKCNASGVEKEDLVQEGLLALHLAAKDYDPNNGAKFSTFAHMRITFAMKKILRRNQLVRYPVEFTYNDIIKTRGKIKSTSEKVYKFDNDNDTTYSDIICESEADSVDVVDSVFLDSIVNKLSSRSRNTLLLLCKGYTLKEIGDSLGVTPQSVMYTKSTAIKKLRAMS